MTSLKKRVKMNDIKKISTLENKHRMKIKEFELEKNNLVNIEEELVKIKEELSKKMEIYTQQELKKRAELLDRRDALEYEIDLLKNNTKEMDYYDKTGDILTSYYNIKENEDSPTESINILSLLSKKKSAPEKQNNKSDLFERYCQITEGIRVNHDDGSKRLKYCIECKIEKILNVMDSAYVCPICGEKEDIIMDEDVQIKDYSPYKRLNRFREWLNAFQAKQSPEIDETVYDDIKDELNKNRITDLSLLTRHSLRLILKKLKYNMYYEHIHYIINRLSGIDPPKITRDMEKTFIRMFLMIQEPWSRHKPPDRKNFLSYSFVLHKFCELLELDHLLECFPLHKQLDILMENDAIWKKICHDLNWDFISAFK
jgi:hypothetical protein